MKAHINLLAIASLQLASVAAIAAPDHTGGWQDSHASKTQQTVQGGGFPLGKPWEIPFGHNPDKGTASAAASFDAAIVQPGGFPLGRPWEIAVGHNSNGSASSVADSMNDAARQSSGFPLGKPWEIPFGHKQDRATAPVAASVDVDNASQQRDSTLGS